MKMLNLLLSILPLALAGQVSLPIVPYQPDQMGQVVVVPASTYGYLIKSWWDNPDSTVAVFKDQDLKVVRGPLIFVACELNKDWFQWVCTNCESFWDAPLLLRARKHKKA